MAKYDDEKDNKKAVYEKRNKEHYARLLERLKKSAMTERQREALDEVEKSGDGEARIAYSK